MKSMFWVKKLMKYKKEFIFSVIFTILSGVCEVAAPLILGAMMESIIALEYKTFFVLFALALSNEILSVLIHYIGERFEIQYTTKTTAYIREEMLSSILSQSIPKFKSKDKTYYTSSLIKDIDLLVENYLNVIVSVCYYLVMFVGCTLALFCCDIFLGVFTILYAIANLYVPKLFEKKIGKATDKLMHENKNMMSILTEAIEGFTVLVVNGYKGKMEKECDTQIEKTELSKKGHLGIFIKQNHTLGLFSSIGQEFVWFIAVIKFLFFDGAFGLITITGNYMGRICSSLQIVISMKSQMDSCKAVFDKIDQFREMEEEAGTKQIDFKNRIEVKEMDYGYDENKKIFNHFSAIFEKGKKYAVLGKSGSGKSTLLRLIAGYISPNAGRIEIDKEEIKEIEPENLYGNIGYLEQTPYVFSTTIEENILLDKPKDEAKLKEVYEIAGLSDFVAFEDLNKEVEENGKNLSGGQIQRICLARALYQDKKILLIDEGFSAIDVKKADEIERKVLAIKELTVINVTHHLSEQNEAYYDEKLVLSGIGLD